MIADCKIIILYLHIDKIKFDYVKLNFRCFRLPVFRSGRIERLCIRDGISIVFEELDSYYVNAEQELYTTLLKAYQKLKIEKVENIQNLIFVYVKNWFIEKPIAAKVFSEKRLNSESSPHTITKDWLE